MLVHILYEPLHVVVPACQVGYDPLAVFLQGLAQCGLPQVKVHYQHLLPFQGHPRGHVHRDEGLPGIGVERRDHDHTAVPVLPCHHHVQIGPQDPERLVDHVPAPLLHHDPAVAVVEPVPADVGDVAFQGGLHLRYLGKERDAQPRQVLLPLDRAVHHPAEEDDPERDARPEHQGHEQDHHPVRGDRPRSPRRGDDEPRVRDVHQTRYLVLLTFLQEVDIQRLRHLLLSLYPQQLHLLTRTGRDAQHDLVLLAPDLLRLKVERREEVVYRADDRAPDGKHGRIEVGYQRVVLAAGGDELVALEHQLVVLRDLALDVGVRQARVRRDKGVGVDRIRKVVPDVPGYRQLVVHLERACGVFRRLVQVGLRQGLHVRQPVLLLVFLQARLDPPELLLDHDQPLVDELRGVPCRTVLVVDPFVVVRIDEGAQDVLGPGGIGVLQGEHHHRGLLPRDARAEPLGVCLGLGIAVGPPHGDVVVPAADVVGRRIQDYVADGGGQGVPQCPFNAVFLHLFRPDGEPG